MNTEFLGCEILIMAGVNMFSSRISWTCLVLREDVRRVGPAGARVALIGPGACRVKKRCCRGTKWICWNTVSLTIKLIKHGDVLRNLEHWTRSYLQGVKIHGSGTADWQGFFATTFSSTQLLTQTQRGVLAMAIHHIPIGGSEWEEVVDSDALPDNLVHSLQAADSDVILRQ
jgi:hypothetical protein